MKAGLQRLRAELASDRRAAERRFDELAELDSSALAWNPGACARVAVAVHHLYGALEALFARLADALLRSIVDRLD